MRNDERRECVRRKFCELSRSSRARVIDAIDRDAFDRAIGLVQSAWQDGRQIIVSGNGGSALAAEHYITDWNKGIYMATGRPFRGVCLSENMGLVSAYANDLAYEDVFVAQLKPVMSPRDLVIGISGSGNSENVLRAIRYANENGGVTLGITGYDGGKLHSLAAPTAYARRSTICSCPRISISLSAIWSCRRSAEWGHEPWQRTQRKQRSKIGSRQQSC